MKRIDAWECSFCDYRSYLEEAVGEHEKECVHNPANKCCSTCGHFKEVDADSVEEMVEEARNIIKQDSCFEGMWFEIRYCRQMEKGIQTNLNVYWRDKINCKLWIEEETE
jgi:hypothetical protein